MSKLSLVRNLWNNRENLDVDILQNKFKAFTRMLPLMMNGEYKPKHKKNIIIGVGAVLYAVSPLDLIPDFLTGPFGFLDDFVILGYGMKKVNEEIDLFLAWEEKQKEELLHQA